jgi:hypothetical protein
LGSGVLVQHSGSKGNDLDSGPGAAKTPRSEIGDGAPARRWLLFFERRISSKEVAKMDGG